jgi:hypothetical protein
MVYVSSAPEHPIQWNIYEEASPQTLVKVSAALSRIGFDPKPAMKVFQEAGRKHICTAKLHFSFLFSRICPPGILAYTMTNKGQLIPHVELYPPRGSSSATSWVIHPMSPIAGWLRHLYIKSSRKPTTSVAG